MFPVSLCTVQYQLLLSSGVQGKIRTDTNPSLRFEKAYKLKPDILKINEILKK